MGNTQVALYKYIKLSSGDWRYCKPAYATNNKRKPHIIVTPDGNAERHEEGQYYLGCRNGVQVWEPVGTDPAEAQRLQKEKGIRVGVQSPWGSDRPSLPISHPKERCVLPSPTFSKRSRTVTGIKRRTQPSGLPTYLAQTHSRKEIGRP